MKNMRSIFFGLATDRSAGQVRHCAAPMRRAATLLGAAAGLAALAALAALSPRRAGVEPLLLTQAEFAAYLKSEAERWGPVIRNQNIKSD